MGEDLCVVLDLQDLVRITGLRLEPGTFDGAACGWRTKDERGTVTMSYGSAKQTAAYIEELESLDIGTAVTVAGAEDAAAVTLTCGSGSSRSTRVGLVAKVGHRRLSVTLTSKDATLEMAIALAELVTLG
jgi:hypothetical protein